MLPNIKGLKVQAHLEKKDYIVTGRIVIKPKIHHQLCDIRKKTEHRRNQRTHSPNRYVVQLSQIGKITFLILGQGSIKIDQFSCDVVRSIITEDYYILAT
uniref:Uncharacterized protein n=1 Tax=Romanomermis culicivorax TaxID=13658 RepID=A0A915I307_ROMCU